jgi:histidine triad (HIT) family protein
MSDTSCLFCRIVAREVPADVLRESETVLAFRDINPQAPIHFLVIPKQHIESLESIEDGHADVLTDMVQAATQLARAEETEGAWRMVSNVGPEAGQSVFHLHLHVLGGRPMTWPPG